MHGLGSAIYFAFYGPDIGVPDMIGTSVGVAYIVSEMNTLIANITFRHF